MTNLLENVRKRRTKILVMLTANQMNEQPLENRLVPSDQDLGHWSSYLKKKTPIVDSQPYLLNVGLMCETLHFR